MDDIDRSILRLLGANARMPTSAIAREVGLSVAPTARRIERMQSEGVIRGFTVVLGREATTDLEAFTEIRLTGTTETGTLEGIVKTIPEAKQFFAVAGDPDILVRLEVRDVDHLQQVVNKVRRSGLVAGTRTLIVLRSWDRDTEQA